MTFEVSFRYRAEFEGACRRCGQNVMFAIRVADGKWRSLDPNGGEHWAGCAGRRDRVFVGRKWKGNSGRAMCGRDFGGNAK